MGLKKFIPPVLADFIRKNRKIIKYKSYEEALSHCSANAYQNEELCNMIADKTVLYIESQKKKLPALHPTTVYAAFALNYFVNSYNKKTITVLDFGGACGIHYYEIRNILHETISLKWIVVETKQMVSSALDRKLANEELSFVSSIEDASVPIDFVHSSSTLQYVPSPYDLLKKLIDIKAKMILLNRMMFNKNNEDIITVQQSFLSSNGQGGLPLGYVDKLIRYPHFTMAFDKMNSIVTDNGYKCLFEFEEKSGKFSLGKENILGKGLLYVS